MNAPELQVQFDPSSARFGASRAQKRLEDDRLLAGKGLFSDDRAFPGEAWLVVVRSPHAHARIASIDLRACRRADGVLAAWTMADLRAEGVGHIPFPPAFKRADGSSMAAPPRTPLAEGSVRYVGQPVVAVVAGTRAQAQDAAELAAIGYEDFPCVTDARSAVASGAPLVWPEATGNIAAEATYGNPAEVEKAFAGAAHFTALELHNQRVIAVAMSRGEHRVAVLGADRRRLDCDLAPIGAELDRDDLGDQRRDPLAHLALRDRDRHHPVAGDLDPGVVGGLAPRRA
jgi:carbon-monoxide dehydrogenase large subunit